VKPAIALSGPLTASALVDWVRGKDIGDDDGDTITAETRREMGDPLHSRPATVIYGGTGDAPDLFDDALYVVTNDGVLHAIDPTNPSDESLGGTEYWSFVPRNLLGRTRDLYYNRILGDPEDRGYGLDGNIRVMRIDNNNNGIIETADEVGKRDKVYLFFGQRRGGSTYYAIDVSTKTSPKVMWARDYTAALAVNPGRRPSLPRCGSAALRNSC
jgi:type IV pilus assembly protein PilY1